MEESQNEMPCPSIKIFLKNTCRKSKKGVFLQRQKSQKGAKYARTKISKRCKPASPISAHNR